VETQGVAGEQDATVIPFPQHRVRAVSDEVNDEAEAAIVVLGQDFDADTGAPGVPSEPSPVGFHRAESKIERRAHNVSLHALAARGQSRQEIEQRMKAREIPVDVISVEIERLEGAGLIDDDELARELVDKYSTRGGLGRRGVAQKLRQRSLPNETIERVLSELSDDDELVQLREVAEDRARSLSHLPPTVAKRRLVAYLNRRGYSGGSVYEIAGEVLA
jgi:regulatory protein